MCSYVHVKSTGNVNFGVYDISTTRVFVRYKTGLEQFCTWRRPSWSKRRTVLLLHLFCYVNAHVHYCWSEAVAMSLYDIILSGSRFLRNIRCIPVTESLLCTTWDCRWKVLMRNYSDAGDGSLNCPSRKCMYCNLYTIACFCTSRQLPDSRIFPKEPTCMPSTI